ncbi:hypothetical protein N665_1407s0004 [Sinapis alba]|nr:hypothetical protein N665_1407s0004 [Sinapis alba]
MKAPDSFWNPNRGCDFHNDHGHKTEELSGVKHAAAKKSTRNVKNGQEAVRPKRLLLGTDEISFTAKEQENVLAPHHDALVTSLTVANCLVKRILVDNRSSTNIIFQTAYHELGLEKDGLVGKSMYAEEINMSMKFLVVDCKSSYNMILGCPCIHDMGAIPSTLRQMANFVPPKA